MDIAYVYPSVPLDGRSAASHVYPIALNWLDKWLNLHGLHSIKVLVRAQVHNSGKSHSSVAICVGQADVVKL